LIVTLYVLNAKTCKNIGKYQVGWCYMSH